MKNLARVRVARLFSVCAVALLPIILLAQKFHPMTTPPPPPSGVWAVAGSTSVTLRWNFVVGSPVFSIYRSTTPGGEGAVPIATTSYLYYTDSSAMPGTTYYYKVADNFSGGAVGVSSTEVSANPGSPLLQAPLGVGQPTPAGVNLFWNVVPGATYYNVYRYDNNFGNQLIAHVVGNLNTTFTDTTGIPGYQNQYLIAAGNLGSLGTFSGYIYSVIGDAPTIAPSGLWAIPYASTVNLSWNPVPSALQYVVYRSLTPGGEGTRPLYISGGAYTSVSLAATPGVTYYYKVAAIDSSGVGHQSPETQATSGGSRLPAPLLVGNTGSGGIVLNWTAVPGATAYRLFRNDPSGNLSLYRSFSAPILATTDYAVTPGLSYTYSLAASDASGIGSYNNQLTVKAGAKLPPAPTGVAVDATSNYNYVHWNSVPGVINFDVYRGTSIGAESLYRTSVSNTYIYDYGIALGTRYYYKLKGVSSGSEGAFSPESSGKPGAARLSASNVTLNLVAGKIQLSYGAVPGATAYNVYRSDDGASTFYLLQANIPTTNFVDTQAVNGVNYSYYVSPINLDGEGNASNIVSGTPGGAPISAPTGTLAYAGANSIEIVCDPVPTAATYNVYRSLTPTMSAVPYATGVSTTYYDYGVAAGTRYYYSMTAVDPSGESSKSVVVSARVGAAALSAPVLVLNQATSTSLLLQWNPIPGAAAYDIVRYDNFGTYKVIRQNYVGTTYTDPALVTGAEYFYYVSGVSLDGIGSRSNTVSGVPGSLPLPTPYGLMAQANEAGGIYLHFNTLDAGNVTYNLYRSTSPGGEGAIPVVTGLSYYNYTDNGLTPGVTYYYKITATDFHGQSLFSSEAQAKVDAAQLASPTITPTVVGSSIKLDWVAIPGASSYAIYRSSTGIYGNNALRVGVAGTTFTDSTPLQGVAYTYWITAVDSDGEGQQSNYVTLHT